MTRERGIQVEPGTLVKVPGLGVGTVIVQRADSFGLDTLVVTGPHDVQRWIGNVTENMIVSFDNPV